MAQFRLAPGCVSIAVVHRSVEEIWCFTAGQGRLWRKLGAHEDVTDVRAGVSIAIPVGAQFQFRNESDTALEAIGVTMPPWPGSDEAMPVNGIWDVVLP